MEGWRWDRSTFFFGGFVSGVMIAQCLVKLINRVMNDNGEQENAFEFKIANPNNEPGFGMTAQESIKTLRSFQMINNNHSSAVNARCALAWLTKEKLSLRAKACVVYAIDVLQSEADIRSIPAVLKNADLEMNGVLPLLQDNNMDSPTNLPKHSDATIKQWLLSNFTTIAPQKHINKRTFRNIAMGIRFAIRLRKSIDAPHTIDSAFVFEVSAEELESINTVLKDVDDWNWSVWSLVEVTNERPLQVLGWHILNKWNLVDTLRIDRGILREWLTFVEDMYEDNPYHNSIHAADVLHAVHFFLSNGAGEHLSHLTIFALFFTAMVHDAGHDGFSNIYHQNALTDRALMFNDQSIQENFHSMSIFRSMYSDSRINILSTFTIERAREVRRLVVMMTLGTDMKHHFSNLQDFKDLIKSQGPDLSQWVSPKALDTLCVMLLHSADLSNPCRPSELAKKWAGLVLEEFFNQGDIEKELGLPVSPLCSRDSTLMPASQIYFIMYIVEPTYQVSFRDSAAVPCESLRELSGRGFVSALSAKAELKARPSGRRGRGNCAASGVDTDVWSN